MRTNFVAKGAKVQKDLSKTQMFSRRTWTNLGGAWWSFVLGFCLPVNAAENPVLFPQLGHSGKVVAVAFSPDGKVLVSGGDDKTIKLWDVALGREIRVLRGHKKEISSVAFSPDGKYIVSTGVGENQVRLWDTATGQKVKTLTSRNAFAVAHEADGEYQGESLSACFSPDGKKIAAGWLQFIDEDTAAYSIKVFDVESGQVIQTYLGHKETISAVAYSPDGRFLASGSGWLTQDSKDNTVRLWDVRSAKEIKRFLGHKKGILALAFSPDGQRIASGGMDKTAIIWNVASGKKERVLIDNSKGDLPDVFLSVYSVSFSPDGKRLVSGTPKSANLWDISTGKLSHKFQQEDGLFGPATLSPDGQLLATGIEAAIKLWDTHTHAVAKVFGGDVIEPDNAIFLDQPSGLKIVRLFKRHLIVDLSQGTMVPGDRYLGRLMLDNRFFLEDAIDRSFTAVVDGDTNKEVLRRSSAEPADFYLFQIKAISDDGAVALVEKTQETPNNSTLLLYDLKNKKIVATLISTTFSIDLQSASFSPDGSILATSSYIQDASANRTYLLTLWGVATGKQLKILETRDPQQHGKFVTVVDFSPDGRTLLAGYGGGTISLWALNSKEELLSFHGHDAIVGAVAFAPDGKTFLSGAWDGSMALWESSTGKKIKDLVGHALRVTTLHFSKDGQHAVSTSKDGTTRLWNLSTGQEMAQFISFKDDEWIVFTPEGTFNASAQGANHLNVRIGKDVYSIDNFYEKFFNPAHVAAVLSGTGSAPAEDIRAGVLRPPRVRFVSPEVGTATKTDALEVVVAALDMGGGIDEIRLYHNDKVVGGETRAIKVVPRGPEATRTFELTLTEGLNTFRAVGFSKDRTESNPVELQVSLAAPSKDVSLYVLAAGINRYQNPALNLNYAEPDAKGITAFFLENGSRLFKKVEILELYNEAATKENLAKNFKKLQNTQPQDAVVIYLAGHGENVQKQWYFLPHEVTYPEREAEVMGKGVSSEELSGYIKDTKAQKVLVLIDACKAGAVLVAFRGFEDRKALSQLARSTGVHIVAASTKDQLAAEVSSLGHGLFTYLLLEGLGGKGSAPGETVTVRKLLGYIEQQLPELTKKYRQESQYPVVDSRGMDFPLSVPTP